MNNDFFKSYQTAEWQRKKNAVLERDNYTCQICGEKNGLMQVHHISYKRCDGKAYSAPMGDLVTLCEECHRHDDGDHKHFYDGRVILDCGFGYSKPKITILKPIEQSAEWYGYDGLLISFRYNGNEQRSIGYRIDGFSSWQFGYFLEPIMESTYVWVNEIFNPNYAEEQAPADPNEVEKFKKAIELYEPNIEWFMRSHGEACYVAYEHFKDGIFWEVKKQRRPYPKVCARVQPVRTTRIMVKHPIR